MSFKRTMQRAFGLAPKTIRVTGRFQGGGAASDCTKLASAGITSVKYNAATGAYKITFDDVGEVLLGGAGISIQTTAGTTATARLVNTTVYSATAKTMTFFVVDVATPTAKDVATTEEVWIDLLFADTDGPVS